MKKIYLKKKSENIKKQCKALSGCVNSNLSKI